MSGALLTALIGLVVGLSTTPLGYLTYQRSKRADEVVEQAGISSAEDRSIGQAIQGLNMLADALQDDNAALREDNRALKSSVRSLTARLDKVINECAELRRQLALLSA